MQSRLISRTKAKRLARKLLKDKRTWRKIAEEDYGNRVGYALLCKFAQRGGEWFPQDENILKVLGILKDERSPYSMMPRWWMRTPEALLQFILMKGRVKKLSDDTRKAQKGKL